MEKKMETIGILGLTSFTALRGMLKEVSSSSPIRTEQLEV